jgi:hypothetical protein
MNAAQNPLISPVVTPALTSGITASYILASSAHEARMPSI